MQLPEALHFGSFLALNISYGPSREGACCDLISAQRPNACGVVADVSSNLVLHTMQYMFVVDQHACTPCYWPCGAQPLAENSCFLVPVFWQSVTKAPQGQEASIESINQSCHLSPCLTLPDQEHPFVQAAFTCTDQLIQNLVATLALCTGLPRG